jgi:hypothetical protein
MRLLSKCNEDLQMCQPLIFCVIFCEFPGLFYRRQERENRRIPLYFKYLRVLLSCSSMSAEWDEAHDNPGDDQAGCALVSSLSGRPNSGRYRPKFNSKSLGTP